jgi:hypothetical protein
LGRVTAVRTAGSTLPQAPFGWIDEPPGINRLLGIQWLAATLYPGTDGRYPGDCQRFLFPLLPCETPMHNLSRSRGGALSLAVFDDRAGGKQATPQGEGK